MTVRRAAVAGRWYPGTPEALGREIDRHLAAARAVEVPGRLVGLVSPHAGLHYSGPVAAYGYGLLRGCRPLTAVLIGPSHRVPFEGVAVDASSAWETPLGRAVVDEDAAGALLAAGAPLVFEDADPHRAEHSLEMQLPFLQHLVPSLRIVPLLMGSQSSREIEGLAQALAVALQGRDVLLVASSDLSHYRPAAIANRLDAAVADAVGRFAADDLALRLSSQDNVACGGGPIVSVMKAARSLGADRATILKYADSGDVEPGDKDQVVGYLSAAFTASAS